VLGSPVLSSGDSRSDPAVGAPPRSCRDYVHGGRRPTGRCASGADRAPASGRSAEQPARRHSAATCCPPWRGVRKHSCLHLCLLRRDETGLDGSDGAKRGAGEDDIPGRAPAGVVQVCMCGILASAILAMAAVGAAPDEPETLLRAVPSPRNKHTGRQGGRARAFRVSHRRAQLWVPDKVRSISRSKRWPLLRGELAKEQGPGVPWGTYLVLPCSGRS